jgi:hypothetical protein
MMKFKCTLVHKMYQTVEVEANDWQEAELLAVDLFDDALASDDIEMEVYDTVEVTE